MNVSRTYNIGMLILSVLGLLSYFLAPSLPIIWLIIPLCVGVTACINLWGVPFSEYLADEYDNTREQFYIAWVVTVVISGCFNSTLFIAAILLTIIASSILDKVKGRNFCSTGIEDKCYDIVTNIAKRGFNLVPGHGINKVLVATHLSVIHGMITDKSVSRGIVLAQLKTLGFVDESYDSQIEGLLKTKEHERERFVGEIKTINEKLEELRKNKLIEELAGITDGSETNTLP